jgi:hypothetical protein
MSDLERSEAHPAAPTGERRSDERRRQPATVWVALALAAGAFLLAVFSLVVNGLLIQRLQATREDGRRFAYSGTVPISQTVVFPFQGTVPFQGSVPFQGVVPVVINIPILGAQRINVPVNTNVYVDTSVDVSTSVTVPVQMAFPFDVEMPVTIPVDIALSLDEQPELRDLLSSIRAFLAELRTLFGD